MRLNDLRIGRQLILSMAIVFSLVLLLSIVSWINANQLWQNTADIYEHPYRVRVALGELKADVLTIHRDMRQMVIESQPEKVDRLISNIAAYEADMKRQMSELYAAYLGPSSDIDAIVDAMDQWKAIRAETVRLVRAGDQAAAGLRVGSDGPGGMQTQRIVSLIGTMDQFAQSKALTFFQMAYGQLVTIARQQVIIPIVILLALLVIALMINKGIMVPLHELTRVTRTLRQGEMSVRSQYHSKNEYGQLSDAFNTMAESLETEIKHKDQMAAISSAMLQPTDLKKFCEAVLLKLMELSDAQIGAFYIRSNDKNRFELIAAIGANTTIPPLFSADAFTGELGLALAAKKTVYTSRISDDHQVTFSAVSGEHPVHSILTVPIFQDAEIMAVISLSSLKEMPASIIRLTDGISNELSARVISLRNSMEVLHLSNQLKRTNDDLAEQAKELSMQTDELSEQISELKKRLADNRPN